MCVSHSYSLSAVHLWLNPKLRWVGGRWPYTLLFVHCTGLPHQALVSGIPTIAFLLCVWLVGWFLSCCCCFVLFFQPKNHLYLHWLQSSNPQITCGVHWRGGTFSRPHPACSLLFLSPKPPVPASITHTAILTQDILGTKEHRPFRSLASWLIFQDHCTRPCWLISRGTRAWDNNVSPLIMTRFLMPFPHPWPSPHTRVQTYPVRDKPVAEDLGSQLLKLFVGILHKKGRVVFVLT